MRHVLLVMAIVAMSASHALADIWPNTPALVNDPVFLGTHTGSFDYRSDDISVGQPYYPSIPATLVAFDPGASPVDIGQDYTVSARIRFDTDIKTELGVIARFNENNNQMYEASLNPNNGGYFILNSVTGLVPTKLGDTHNGDVQGNGTLASFNMLDDYVISLTVSGFKLDARCYDATGTTLLKEIVYDDNPGVGQGGSWAGTGLLAGGFAFAASGSSGVAGHFLDHNITLPIPEPGAVAMLLTGALALLGWAGLRRSRG
jgi:hypothetical protein